MGSAKHWSAWTFALTLLLLLLVATPRATLAAEDLGALSASTMQQILQASKPSD